MTYVSMPLQNMISSEAVQRSYGERERRPRDQKYRMSSLYDGNLHEVSIWRG